MARPSKHPTNTIKKTKIEHATYLPPLQTDIPDEVEDAFAALGFQLKWVRVLEADDKADNKNIRKRIQQGFTFVTHEELGNMDFRDAALLWEHWEGTNPKLKGMVMNGDVALAKRSLDMADGHRDYTEGRAWDQIKGVNDQVGLRTQMSRGGTGAHTLLNESSSTFGRRSVGFARSPQVEESEE